VAVSSETPGSEAGETWREMAVNFAYEASLSYSDGFTSPPKEIVLRIFIALKNPSYSVGFEPANLGSNDKHDNH
jgi:hypothetical protein